MASETSEIREAIDQTRAEMGDTVRALAHKADVKARAHEKVDHAKYKGKKTAQDAVHKAADVTGSAVRPVAKVASNKRFTIPAGAALAGAGGIFLALRVKNRSGS